MENRIIDWEYSIIFRVSLQFIVITNSLKANKNVSEQNKCGTTQYKIKYRVTQNLTHT